MLMLIGGCQRLVFSSFLLMNLCKNLLILPNRSKHLWRVHGVSRDIISRTLFLVVTVTPFGTMLLFSLPAGNLTAWFIPSSVRKQTSMRVLNCTLRYLAIFHKISIQNLQMQSLDSSNRLSAKVYVPAAD